MPVSDVEPLPDADERTVEASGRTYTLKRDPGESVTRMHGKHAIEPSGAHPDKRPNRTSRHRKELKVEIGIALQAVQSAIEGLKAVQPGMLRHRLEQVMSDPVHQLGLVERSLVEAMRRVQS